MLEHALGPIRHEKKLELLGGMEDVEVNFYPVTIAAQVWIVEICPCLCPYKLQRTGGVLPHPRELPRKLGMEGPADCSTCTAKPPTGMGPAGPRMHSEGVEASPPLGVLLTCWGFWAVHIAGKMIKHARLGLPWATSCFQKPRQHETDGSLLILRLFVRPKFQSYLE